MSGKNNSPQIIVVEQEAYLARIICRGLKKAGYRVKHISTGVEALERISANSPDFVIVATEMHPMSGEEFCRRLQSEQPDRSFPVVVLTDSAQDMYNRWSQWFSNFRMIDKPVSLRLIIEFIEKDQGQAA